MHRTQLFLRSLIAFTLLSVGAAQATEEFAASSCYFGGNIGLSYLKPGTNDTAFDNSKNTDFGFGVFTGYKLTPTITMQVNYNDLGKAEIKNSTTQQKADVGYKTFSVDVRKTVWQSAQDWSVFAGAGIDHLNKKSSTADFSKENAVALKLIAGADYRLLPGLYLRPQIETFSTHAAYASIGLVKYIGAQKKSAVAAPIAAPAVEQQNKVDELKIAFSDIQFETNSAKITPKAARILNNAAQIIAQTTQQIEIQAYTDNRGKEAYNLALSEKRAQAMVDYLVAQGVSKNRLTAKGYGSANPIGNNAIEEGRIKNRRATFQLK